jgi:hypothetical protein
MTETPLHKLTGWRKYSKMIMLQSKLDDALELLRQIRDNEVNAQDEADKFLRDHVPSKLSAVTEAFRRQAANMAFVINHIQLPDAWYKKFTEELEQDREYVNQQTE